MAALAARLLAGAAAGACSACFLRSIHSNITNWTFEDTLSQIGMGYGFLYLLAWRSPRAQWTALIAILVGYWLAFALYPLPGPAFDWAKAGMTPDLLHYKGFAAHWDKNTNFAWAFDNWFMNLFPRATPFTHNDGGYSTLSFIPTLGTMILGLFAGEVLRGPRKPLGKVGWFAVAGAIGVGLGLLLNATGICPVVKRIWTPSWVLFSGGLLLPDAWRVLPGDGRLAAPRLGVSADGRGDEFHRRIPDRPSF